MGEEVEEGDDGDDGAGGVGGDAAAERELFDAVFVGGKA